MTTITVDEKRAALRVMRALFDANVVTMTQLAPVADAVNALVAAGEVEPSSSPVVADVATCEIPAAPLIEVDMAYVRGGKRNRDVVNEYEIAAGDDDATVAAKRRRCDDVRASLTQHLDALARLRSLSRYSSRRFDPRHALPLTKTNDVDTRFIEEVAAARVFVGMTESTSDYVARNGYSHLSAWHTRRLICTLLTDVDGWAAFDANHVRPVNWSRFERLAHAYNQMTGLGRVVVRAHFHEHVRAQQ